MRLWLKPDQLAKLNLSVPDIVNAVQAQNTVNSAGQIGSEPVPNGQEYTYTARAKGRLTTPEEFGEIVVRQQFGWRHGQAQGCRARRSWGRRHTIREDA